MKDTPLILSTVRPTWRIKDLTTELGDVCERTVKRWRAKLKIEPDYRKGGPGAPHLWTQAGAEKFVLAWRSWWAAQGHTAEAMAAKYTGDLTARQIQFTFENSFPKKVNAKSTPQIRIQPAGMVKAIARPKTGGDEEKKQTRPRQSGKGHAAAA